MYFYTVELIKDSNLIWQTFNYLFICICVKYVIEAKANVC